MDLSLTIDEECGAQPFAARSFPVGGKGLHLWGSTAPSGGTSVQATWVDPTVAVQFFRQCRAATPGLWQITTTAKEYRRIASEGTLLPLPDTASSQIPPGVDPFTRRTIVQMRVHANDGADERVFDMDANQSIAVVAQEACVYWLGPAGMIDLLGEGNRTSPSLERTGLVIDSFLGVAISRIEQQPGDNSTVQLTRHLYVPAGTRGSIAIPPYAQAVQIFQEPTLGTASLLWTQTLGDPNGVSGFMTQASLPFIPGARRTQQESIIGNPSHLWTDLDPDFDRFYTLVWTIRP